MASEEWRSVERRNIVVNKIADIIRSFPSPTSSSMNPREIETTIFMRATNEQDYMNTVGRIMVSIRNKSTGVQGNMPTAIHPHLGSHLARPLPPGGYNLAPSPYGMPGAGMGPMAPGMPPGHNMAQRPRMMPTAMPQPAPTMYHHHGQIPGMPNMVNMVGPGGTHTVPHQPIYPRSVGMPPTMAPGLPGMIPGPQIDPYHTVQATPIRPPSVPSPYPFQNSPGGPGSVPPASMTGPPSVPPHSQAPSPAPRPPQPAPAPSPTPAGRGMVASSSPKTPWNPSSPAPSGSSPGPPMVPPEANEAYLRKLQELSPYIPLLARMIEKLKKTQCDETRTEQFMKMDNLYSLLRDKTRRVPLATLDKCERVLKNLFERPPSSPPVQPTIPTTTTTAPAASSPQAPPVPPPPVPTSSILHFNMLHSPLPLSSSLLPTLKASEDPLDRLPPEQRAKLCPPGLSVSWDGRDASKMVLKREISYLKQFSIKELQRSQDAGLDGSIELECSLVDDGLPSVPPITVHIPWNYPSSSPVCQLASYQSGSSAAFLREVAWLLGNQLTCCRHNYSLSYLLGCWENSVLEVTCKEISSHA